MSRSNHTQAILLLADGFEEAPISIFLATLRQAGVAVKLVGLRAKQVNGSHGLTIVPDMSLDRLLETGYGISAIILPDGAGHLTRLSKDPRVRALFESIDKAVMLVSLGPQAEQMVGHIITVNPCRHLAMKLEPGENLETFAHKITGLLLNL